MMTPQLSIILLFAGTCIAQGPAQHVFLTSGAERWAGTDAAKQFLQIIPQLSGERLGNVVPDSWESQVLSAGRRAGERSLNINFAELGAPAIYTLSPPEGDVLVARWNGASSLRPEQSIWLWDTPSETTFVVEINPFLLQPKELLNYAENLFAWDRFVELKSLALMYAVSTAGHEKLVGYGRCLETERGIYWLHFNAAAFADHAYAMVAMSKSMFAYPPEAFEVPERFPPLRLRLADVPRSALFDELGKGYATRVRFYPENRDRIILSELLSRAPLTDAEVREIVIGRFDDGKSENAEVLLNRFNALLDALARQNRLAAYLPALEHFFIETELPVRKWMQSTLAARFLGVMRTHHVDASRTSLAFLEHGKFVRESLFDLTQNGRDEATLDRLAKVGVPAELRQEKDLAVKGIRERLVK